MSSACSCPSAFVAACETMSCLFAMNWLNVFCTFGLSHAELPTWAFLTFRRALPRAFLNDSCLSQHVQVRKEVPARRSGPEAKQVSWTRSQNQSTNTKKKLTSTSICLRACLCPAVGSILRTCDKPLCREWRQYTKPDFWENMSIPFPQAHDNQTDGGNYLGSQFHHVSIVRFKHKPLAFGTHKEAGKCYIYVCPQNNYSTIPSYIRCEDGLPWIMLIWRLMWEKRWFT